MTLSALTIFLETLFQVEKGWRVDATGTQKEKKGNILFLMF
jgi:hypothetical protein